MYPLEQLPPYFCGWVIHCCLFCKKKKGEMSRSAMSKPRGAGDRYSDYFMCGLRSFALHKWMDAINLQTQGSPDLLSTFLSLAMSDSLRQSERLYENWRKLFAKKHSPLLSSPFLLLRDLNCSSPLPLSLSPHRRGATQSRRQGLCLALEMGEL